MSSRATAGILLGLASSVAAFEKGDWVKCDSLPVTRVVDVGSDGKVTKVTTDGTAEKDSPQDCKKVDDRLILKTGTWECHALTKVKNESVYSGQFEDFTKGDGVGRIEIKNPLYDSFVLDDDAFAADKDIKLDDAVKWKTDFGYQMISPDSYGPVSLGDLVVVVGQGDNESRYICKPPSNLLLIILLSLLAVALIGAVLFFVLCCNKKEEDEEGSDEEGSDEDGATRDVDHDQQD